MGCFQTGMLDKVTKNILQKEIGLNVIFVIFIFIYII
jgi:hypothetical protein